MVGGRRAQESLRQSQGRPQRQPRSSRPASSRSR
jgi:hypothetical protein